jgi:hypothetical protein
MKLRSVALIGVVSLAALGLIGAGAHAAFTTSTTSHQTITAGTWGAPPTVAITYPVNNTTYGTNWTNTITGTASSNSGPGTSISAVTVAIEDTATSKWWNGLSFSSSETFNGANNTASWSLPLRRVKPDLGGHLQGHRQGHRQHRLRRDQLDGQLHLWHGSPERDDHLSGERRQRLCLQLQRQDHRHGFLERRRRNEHHGCLGGDREHHHQQVVERLLVQ